MRGGVPRLELGVLQAGLAGAGGAQAAVLVFRLLATIPGDPATFAVCAVSGVVFRVLAVFEVSGSAIASGKRRLDGRFGQIDDRLPFGDGLAGVGNQDAVCKQAHGSCSS